MRWDIQGVPQQVRDRQRGGYRKSPKDVTYVKILLVEGKRVRGREKEIQIEKGEEAASSEKLKKRRKGSGQSLSLKRPG